MRAWLWCSPGPLFGLFLIFTSAWLSSSLWPISFASWQPDTLPHWGLTLFLSGDWHSSSLGPDPGPHYSLTLVLVRHESGPDEDLTLVPTRAWLSSLVYPESGPHLAQSLFLTGLWYSSILWLISGPLYDLTLGLSTTESVSVYSLNWSSLWLNSVPSSLQPESLTQYLLMFSSVGPDLGP